jgi:FlaA1/EpsC-like NDP-sugar epimerase
MPGHQVSFIVSSTSPKMDFTSSWPQVRRLLMTGILLALTALSFAGAFLLRFDFSVESAEWKNFTLTLPLLLLFRCAAFLLFGLHRRPLRDACSFDLLPICAAVALGSAVFAIVVKLVVPSLLFSRSVLLIDWLLLQALLVGFFCSFEIYRRLVNHGKRGRRRALVVGDGAILLQVLREMQSSNRWNPVGLVCPDRGRVGEKLRGITIRGSYEQLTSSARDTRAEIVCFTMPGIGLERLLAMTAECRRAGINFVCLRSRRLVPEMPVLPLDEVRIEEILQREQVSMDMAGLRKLVAGRRVLVTGAGGSIGSELCRQIAALGPSDLYLLERYENNLFFITREIRHRYSDLRIHPLLLDITDQGTLEHEFQMAKPDIVFHAAAHKHVGMMEARPQEAIKNNVIGTYNVALAAAYAGTERLINISTDKAVKPKSYMGLSKRLAEICVQEMSGAYQTKFITVRFGNVAGSTGSVVQLFRQQIEQGGPVTVTDRQARRFFMSIPEAVRLVLQAALLGHGGEIFVLDMGQPMNIYDLAKTMICLYGFVPEVDIPIKFTGLSPGEKLHEELNDTGEEFEKTSHDRIMVIRNGHRAESAEILKRIAQWQHTVSIWRSRDLTRELSQVWPDFTHRAKEPANGAAVLAVTASESEEPQAVLGGHS